MGCLVLCNGSNEGSDDVNKEGGPMGSNVSLDDCSGGTRGEGSSDEIWVVEHLCRVDGHEGEGRFWFDHSWFCIGWSRQGNFLGGVCHMQLDWQSIGGEGSYDWGKRLWKYVSGQGEAV